MKPETLKEFKKRVNEFRKVYDKLVALWNGNLQYGNNDNATFPATVIVSVMLHNMAHDASDCREYDHQREVSKIIEHLEALNALNNYENGCYMTHYPYTELSNLWIRLDMAEDYFQS